MIHLADAASRAEYITTSASSAFSKQTPKPKPTAFVSVGSTTSSSSFQPTSTSIPQPATAIIITTPSATHANTPGSLSSISSVPISQSLPTNTSQASQASTTSTTTIPVIVQHAKEAQPTQYYPPKQSIQPYQEAKTNTNDHDHDGDDEVPHHNQTQKTSTPPSPPKQSIQAYHATQISNESDENDDDVSHLQHTVIIKKIQSNVSSPKSTTLDNPTNTPTSLKSKQTVPSSSGLTGRPPSKATKLRKSIIDPWRAKYNELKVKANESKEKYLPEDFVIQTVKRHFPSDSVMDLDIFTKLRKLFQLAAPTPKKPSPEQCEWITLFNKYLLTAAKDMKEPEYATDIERNKCNVSMPTPTPHTSKKRDNTDGTKLVVNDEDKEEEEEEEEEEGGQEQDPDDSNKHRAKRRRLTMPSAKPDQELVAVVDSLCERFNEIARTVPNYSKPAFWRQIGIEVEADADIQRASRLLRKEFQPNVVQFYQKYKHLIHAFLRNSNATQPSHKEDAHHDDDTAMHKINSFLSRLKTTQSYIRVAEIDMEDDRRQLEQITLRIAQKQQRLEELREEESGLEQRWKTIKNTIMTELIDD